MVTESIVLQFHLLQSIDSIKKQNNCAKWFMNDFLLDVFHSLTLKIKHSLENSILGRVNVGGTNIVEAGACIIFGAYFSGAIIVGGANVVPSACSEHISAKQSSAEQYYRSKCRRSNYRRSNSRRSKCRRSKCRRSNYGRSNCRRSKCRRSNVAGANVLEHLSRSICRIFRSKMSAEHNVAGAYVVSPIRTWQSHCSTYTILGIVTHALYRYPPINKTCWIPKVGAVLQHFFCLTLTPVYSPCTRLLTDKWTDFQIDTQHE